MGVDGFKSKKNPDSANHSSESRKEELWSQDWGTDIHTIHTDGGAVYKLALQAKKDN